ncbi:MAG TPA: PKD domain-containing protein [Pyrinomonadaceae bacterium]|jgi:RHS repeat-associated protein
MSPKSKTTRTHTPNAETFFSRRLVAWLLLLLLYTQSIAPPALAHAASRPTPGGAAAGPARAEGGAAAATAQVVQVPASQGFGIVLSPAATAFDGVVGLDYHQPTAKLVASVNSPTGLPNNFELIEADGAHRAFSNLTGLSGELKIAAARDDDGRGSSLGGFRAGEVFTGTGAAGVIARVERDGSRVQPQWVTLPDEAGLPNGLHLDRTGVFGGDLIAVTTAGNVWRVKSAGAATKVAELGTPLSGVVTIPADADKYGPWAGKILAGAKAQGLVYAVDAQGAAAQYDLGIRPEDLRLTPAHENFYAVDPGEGKLWGAQAAAFAGMVGDVLVAQESPGRLARVRWNGAEFEVGQLASAAQLKQIAFAPAGVAPVPGVRQVYEKIAVVRHAPALDSGRVEGSLWQLLGEPVTLDGTDAITSDLLVPGTPDVTVGGGRTSYGGTVAGTESATPAGYAVTITGGATLRHLVTRTNPTTLKPVAAPPAPAGTRAVSLTQAGQTAGDFATLRDLSLSGKAGEVAVPPGTYGRLTAAGHTALVLGAANSAEPSVYNLESLALSGGSELRVAGPVVLTVKGAVTLTGSTAGNANDPRQLVLRAALGPVTVGGGAVLYALVRAPQAPVVVEGKGRLRGTVACDRLSVAGNGVLQVTEGDLPPPPVNRYPTVDAGPDQTITLPTDTVSLSGSASDDGIPEGSALASQWTKVSGPGAVAFADAASPSTTATFNEPGTYVLRLSANDTLLVSSDEVTVTVVPRNQPPAVSAGAEQTIELPDTATLVGTVSDDALPRGSTLTVAWSKVGGPGDVTFSDPDSATTTASFSVHGSYTLALTATDTELTTTSTVVVNVLPENHAPVVSAGARQLVALPAGAALVGTVTDDGLPAGGALTSAWTKAEGPGAVTFADAASPATTATFGAPGVYTLRLTASDSRLSVSADTVVEVDPENKAPVVGAGPDQTVELPAAAALAGSVMDDSYPRGSNVTKLWTKVSGPGEVTFADATSPVTGATFGAPGEYRLRLTADDSALSASAEVVITVHPENQAPTVNAGADQTIALPNAAGLTGSVQDDGYPLGGTLTSTWGKVSGPGAAVFGDPHAPATSVTFAEPGTYVLRLSADDTRATTSDELTVVVDPRNLKPEVSAGADQAVELPNSAALSGSVSDDGYPRGASVTRSWTVVSGPGSVVFDDPTSPTANATFGAPGEYTLRLSARDTEFDVGDEVVINVRPENRPPTANAGDDITVRLPAAASLAGAVADDGWPYGSTLNASWTKVSGPGDVTFADPASAQTAATFTAPGEYVLRLTASDTRASASDEVKVTVLPANVGPTASAGPDKSAPLDLNLLHNAGNESPLVENRIPFWGSPDGGLWAQAPAGVGALPFSLEGDTYFHTTSAAATELRQDVDVSAFAASIDAGAQQFAFEGYVRAGAGSPPEGSRVVVEYRDAAGAAVLASFDTGEVTSPEWLRVADRRAAPAGTRRVRVRLVGTDNNPAAAGGLFDGLSLRAVGTAAVALEGAASDDGLPAGSSLNVAWSRSSGPGEVSFANPSAAGTSAVFKEPGTYVLKLTANDSEFDAVDEVTVTVGRANLPPTVNAGADGVGSVSFAYNLGGSAADDGLPEGSALTYAWGKVSGPGAVAFGNAASPATTVTFEQPGNYVLRLTAGDSEYAVGDEVRVAVDAANAPPAVNAGPDKTVQLPDNATLSGTASDDGFPRGSALTTQWTKVSGPGTVTFADASQPGTTASFGADGTYVLRLTATDTVLSSADDLTVTVLPVAKTLCMEGDDFDDGIMDPSKWFLSDNNAATVSEQGGRLTITPPANAVAYNGYIAANACDMTNRRVSVEMLEVTANPCGVETYFWLQPLQEPNSFILISKGCNATVFWYTPKGSRTPLQIVYNSVQHRFWRVGHDAATNRVNFETSPDRVHWTVQRSELSTIPLTQIRVQLVTGTYLEMGAPGRAVYDNLMFEASSGNLAPAVEAGPDLVTTMPHAAVLRGAVSDDGKPTAAAPAVAWTKVSGPGAVTFADPQSPQTTATFSAPGSYLLRLAASDGQLTGLDRTTVVVNPTGQYVVVDAGPDRTIRLPETAALQAAVTDGRLARAAPPAYLWSKVSGPGAVNFTSPDAPATTASFGAPGVYVLRFSAGDAGYTGADDLTVYVRPPYTMLADDFNDNTPDPSKWFYGGANIAERSGQLQFDLPGNTSSATGFLSQRTVDMTPDGAFVRFEVADYADPGFNSSRFIYWRMQGSEGNWIQVLYQSGGLELYKNGTRVVRVSNLHPRYWRLMHKTADNAFDFDTSDDAVTWVTRGTTTGTYSFGLDKLTFRLIPGSFGANAGGTVKFDNVNSNLPQDPTNHHPTPVTGGPYTATAGVPLQLDGSRSSDWDDIIVEYSWDFGDGTQGTGATPTHTYAAPGTYTVKLRVKDPEGFTGQTQTTARVLPPNQAPAVNAGADRAIRLPSTATLSGAVSDDGLPEGASVTTQWAKVSGPGAVTFTSPDSPDTGASFGADGTYVLRLTANDTELSAFDEVTVTVEPAPPNQPPAVSAGEDRTATPGLNLVRNPGGEEPPVAGEIPGWTKAAGTTWAQAPAGTGSFYESFEGSTYLHAPGDAQAELRQDIDLTPYAGSIKTGAQQFRFLAWVRAGAEAVPDGGRIRFEFYDATGSTMVGVLESQEEVTTSDSWHGVEGTFAAPAAARMLRVRLLAARHGGETTDVYFDAVSVRALTNAGVRLEGTVTDDGLPSGGATPTAAWSVVSGPGAVTFADASAASTSASFAAPGAYVLRLSGSDGAETRADEVSVNVTAANAAPAAVAGADQTITLPSTTAVAGSVSDDGLPQGRSVSARWRKVAGPGAVTFADAGAASTNVSFSEAGNYVLRLTADDSDLNAHDDLVVTVKPAPVNHAPTAEAGPNQTVSLPGTASLSGQATDDGLPSGSTLSYAWSVVSGPGPVNFSNPHANATTAAFSAEGVYTLRLTVSDSQLTAADELSVTVRPQGTNSAPAVAAGPDQEIRRPADTATLYGSASDDGLPSSGSLNVSWGVLSGPGAVTFAAPNAARTSATFAAAGTYVLRLTATDSQLTAADDVTVSVYETVTGPAPHVEFNAFADGAEITAPKDIYGTVSGGAWRLEYAYVEDELAPAQGWHTFASGTGAVTNGVLGRFDPTVLMNGAYAIRLVSTDAAGQTSVMDSSAVVARQMKVGHFTVSFTDLSLPVAGVPVEVTRSYDSRDKRRGDFGAGWTLGVTSARVQKTVPVGSNWYETESFASIRTYCLESTRPQIITITFGGGRVYKFQAVPAKKCQRFQPFSTVQFTFVPVGGTRGTLTPLNGGSVLVAGSVPGPVDLVDINDPSGYYFNPTRFRLTTEDGTSFVLGQKTGVESVATPAGETLTITGAGITHSSGASVVFVRDELGRVKEIRDPEGRSRFYTYDGNGDLETFKDAEGNTTRFAYEPDHYLKSMEVTGADGTSTFKPINNVWDGGRLVRQLDADGKEIAFEHDLAARREVIRDRLGNPTVYQYDERGNVVYTKDAEGGETWRTYDADDNVLTEKTAAGTTANVYDAAGNLQQTTDPYGNVTKYTYDAMRHVTSVTDPLLRVTTSVYDERTGNLLKTADAEGNETQYTYEPMGSNVTLVTFVPKEDPAHPRYHGYVYNRVGQLVRESDGLGNETGYTYDANNNRKTQTVKRKKADGTVEELVTGYDYDRENRLTKTTYPDETFTEVRYNELGRQSSTRDHLGRVTRHEYDAQGRPARTVYPDEEDEEVVYDEEGRRTSVTDRAGRVTAYKYDKLGRVTETLLPDGGRTTATYDALGRVLTESRWLDATTKHTTTYRYEAEGKRRVVYVTDPLSRTTRQVFDEAGNLWKVTDAKNHTTTFEYDKNDRRTKTVYHDDTSETTAYDGFGQVVAKTDPAAKTTRFTYDAAGRLVKVQDAAGKETAYGYDELGNQTWQRDANLRTTLYEYDGLGRRTKRTLPEGMSERYTYDEAGRLRTRTDFDGKTTTYEYDGLNRLKKKTPDASFGAEPVSFTYTVTGRRHTMTDATGTTTYAYDARDRLLSKQSPQGTLTYTYDKLGGLKTVRSSHDEGVSVDYGYDALGRLASATDNRAAGANTTTYAYDEVGNLESYTYGNGVKSLYGYDARNRLTSLSISKATSAVSSYAYTLGAAGNRESVTEAGGRKVVYTYDDLYRLKGEAVTGDAHGVNGSVGYTYDDVGNRLTRASTLPGVGAQSFAYDKNDRPTSDTYDANGSTRASGGVAYTYDWENRLATAADGAVAYAYDGDGNRVSKTAGGVTTTYLVDANNPTGHAQVVEELQGGAVVRQYTYGSDLISQRRLAAGQWAVSYYGYDGHGSVRLLTDAAGAVTDTYTYDAFGTLVSRTGATPNEYLYAGERFDPETGFYYLRARYVRPDTGRFWTMDSFEGNTSDPLSLHKYLYAGADAVNKVDPGGHFFGGIGEAMAANAIRTTLANVQGIVGQAIMEQVRYGGNAGLADIALGAVLALGVAVAAKYVLPKVTAKVAQLIRGLRKERFFFRGTTVGWAGSAGMQALGNTSTSTNPAISHIFAAESATLGGEGVIHVASQLDLQGVRIGAGNVRAGLEKEIVLEMLPTEFATRASTSITLEQSRDILKGMGIDVPARVFGKADADALIASMPHMTQEQVAEYVRQARALTGK